MNDKGWFLDPSELIELPDDWDKPEYKKEFKFQLETTAKLILGRDYQASFRIKTKYDSTVYIDSISIVEIPASKPVCIMDEPYKTQQTQKWANDWRRKGKRK